MEKYILKSLLWNLFISCPIFGPLCTAVCMPEASQILTSSIKGPPRYNLTFQQFPFYPPPPLLKSFNLLLSLHFMLVSPICCTGIYCRNLQASLKVLFCTEVWIYKAPVSNIAPSTQPLSWMFLYFCISVFLYLGSFVFLYGSAILQFALVLRASTQPSCPGPISLHDPPAPLTETSLFSSKFKLLSDFLSF